MNLNISFPANKQKTKYIQFTDLGFNGNGRKSWPGSVLTKILVFETREENMNNN
jgi:hypothetical protein